MADFLNTLYLYGDVKITRDYSAVHDLTPSAWLTYLKTQTPVWTDSVNYYRVPSVIRVEGNYDTLRKATYGALEGVEPFTTPTFKRPYFFWVDEVRLIKQASYLDTDSSLVNDVVELVVSPDVWSNNWTEAGVNDTYVERMHVDRWEYDSDSSSYVPLYYPDASQGVDGAYKLESEEDVTHVIECDPTYSPHADVMKMWFVVVTAVDSGGNLKYFVIPTSTIHTPSGWTYGGNVYEDSANTSAVPLSSLLDGGFYTAVGVTAENVQSICVIPELPGESVWASYRSSYNAQIDISSLFTYTGMYKIAVTIGNNTFFYLGLVTNVGGEMMWFEEMMHLTTGVITSTVTPVEPSYTTPYNGMAYTEDMEPMLYRGPARIRKLVSGIGGTLCDIPDLFAFEATVSLRNMIDMTSVTVFVFLGDDVRKANAEGCLGVLTSVTLPIFNSAWKSYEAISKTGDEMAFNAQQMSALANGVTSATLGVGMGVMSGGPVGGILSGIGSVIGTGVNMWANDESFKAKQTTIRNSPAVVKSGGSGMGVILTSELFDPMYVTLKIDDKSYETLKRQYHYFGYFVREFMPGDVKSLLSSRKFFNFVQTRGAKVTGDLNADDSKQIAAILDRGVTIYHGTDGYAQIGAGMNLENYEV